MKLILIINKKNIFKDFCIINLRKKTFTKKVKLNTIIKHKIKHLLKVKKIKAVMNLVIIHLKIIKRISLFPVFLKHLNLEI